MKNCWTCKHDDEDHDCAIVCEYTDPPDAVAVWQVEIWIRRNLARSTDPMPPKDADGCPGYAPVAPQDRAQPAARIETEANVPHAPVGEWDPDDDGRDL